MTRIGTCRNRRPSPALCCITLLALFTSAAITAVQAGKPLRPPDGHLLLKGSVQSVTTTQRIIMNVTDVTLPDGETATLTPSRTKQVVISDATKVHVRGQASASVRVEDLKDVQKGPFYVIAIGYDTGPGTDLIAQSVSVWTGSVNGKYVFQKPGD